MATKPENAFIASIHRNRAMKGVYAEKTNNPWRSGTADVWYSGVSGDLWIEYKFIARIPRSKEILPGLTPRQQEWLSNRHDEGRNVAVVLGTPDGGVIYRDKEWLVPLDDQTLRQRLVSKDQLARWIFTQVGAGVCLSLPLPSLLPKS